MWLCMSLISNKSMLRWFMLHRSLIKSGNSSPPRWKNGRNTWRVSQSPRTGTGNLFWCCRVFGWMSWWDQKNPCIAEGHVWPWACSKWTAFWEGQPHQVEIQSQAHQLRMRHRNWFIWWILIHQVFLKKGSNSTLLWLIQHAMGLSFEFQMPPKKL